MKKGCLLFLLFGFQVYAEAPNAEKSSWKSSLVEFVRSIPNFIQKHRISVPVYGNYCGPYHGVPDYSQEPTDEIDEACYWHDICYDANVSGSYSDCLCDVQLVQRLVDAALSANLSYTSLSMAAAIGAWFAVSECQCRFQNGTVALLLPDGPSSKYDCI